MITYCVFDLILVNLKQNVIFSIVFLTKYINFLAKQYILSYHKQVLIEKFKNLFQFNFFYNYSIYGIINQAMPQELNKIV